MAFNMAKQERRTGLPSVLGSQSGDEAFAKLGLKEQGKQIQGDPDEWDFNNIKKLIDLYERAYPGRIGAMKKDVDVELALSGRTKDFGEISKDSELRLSMWLPDGLQEVLEAGYPSLWTNKKHLAWFLQHFPQFRSAPKH